MDEIIQRLGSALDKPGLQAKQLASRLGVTPQTVRNWRGGINFPNKNRWELIEKTTEVPLEWVFQGDTKMRANNPLEEQLLKMYRDMEEPDRDTLLSLANTLYNRAHPGPGLGNPFAKRTNGSVEQPIKKVPARKFKKKKSKPK